MSQQLTQIETPLLTVTDACRFLRVGKTALYALMNSERLGPEPLRLGGKVLFKRRELESWIEAGMPGRKIWRGIQRSK